VWLQWLHEFYNTIYIFVQLYNFVLCTTYTSSVNNTLKLRLKFESKFTVYFLFSGENWNDIKIILKLDRMILNLINPWLFLSL